MRPAPVVRSNDSRIDNLTQASIHFGQKPKLKRLNAGKATPIDRWRRFARIRTEYIDKRWTGLLKPPPLQAAASRTLPGVRVPVGLGVNCKRPWAPSCLHYYCCRATARCLGQTWHTMEACTPCSVLSMLDVLPRQCVQRRTLSPISTP
jgi:hypothetical protein